MSIYKGQQTAPDPQPVRALSEVHSLVDEHRSTGNGYHLRSVEYPTGDVEVLAIKLDAEDSLKRGGGGKRKSTDKATMDDETLRKSQFRSKKLVYQKILTLNADTLLTLTYRENMIDLAQGWKDFRSFNKLMKKRYGIKWQYVCVPERQDRGAIHFHLAIKGHYHWNTVRRFWRQVVGEGNVDFKRRKDKKGRYVVNPKRISRYLAKYLAKQDTVEFNKRRYSSSRIVLPEPIHGWLACGVPVGQVMREIINRITRKPVRSYWEGEAILPIVIMQT